MNMNNSPCRDLEVVSCRPTGDPSLVNLITHWPQLARLADEHFAIRKEVQGGTTFTFCATLSAPGRQAELARMAGETPAVPPSTHDAPASGKQP